MSAICGIRGEFCTAGVCTALSFPMCCCCLCCLAAPAYNPRSFPPHCRCSDGYMRYARTPNMELGSRWLPGPLDLDLVSVMDGCPSRPNPGTPSFRAVAASCPELRAQLTLAMPSVPMENLFGWGHRLPGTESVRSIGQVKWQRVQQG